MSFDKEKIDQLKNQAGKLFKPENQPVAAGAAEAGGEGKRTQFKDRFSSKTFRVGAYSLFSSLAVIIIAVAVNLLVGQIPASITKIDLTAAKLYSFSQQTHEIVEGLPQEVTIYWLVPSGNEDDKVTNLLERYQEMSDKLKVTKVDPIINPKFASQYTDEDIYANSLIVVSGERSQYVGSVYTYDYTTYYMTNDTSDIITNFDGENALTSAISYVTSTDLPKLYTLAGHGESALPSSLSTQIKQQNFDMAELSLLTAENGEVPADCDCLVINSPTKDISTDEKDAIIAYLDGGGELLLFTNYPTLEQPNLLAVTGHYNMSVANGLVVENSGRVFQQNPLYILPTIKSHAITDPLKTAGLYILVPYGEDILIADGGANLSVSQLLVTSDDSYVESDMEAQSSEFNAAAGDTAGPAILGAAVQDKDTGGTIVWYSSGYLLNEGINTVVAGANFDLVINSLSWVCEYESGISIHAKSLSADQLVFPNNSIITLWKIMLIFVVPLVFIASGIMVVVRRRRR